MRVNMCEERNYYIYKTGEPCSVPPTINQELQLHSNCNQRRLPFYYCSIVLQINLQFILSSLLVTARHRVIISYIKI